MLPQAVAAETKKRRSKVPTVLHPSDVALSYRINDAASVLGLSRSSIYELLRDGKLRSVEVGGRKLIPADALRQLLQA